MLHQPPPFESVTSAPGDHLSLALSPERLSLGVIAAGQKAQATLGVTNLTQQPVVADRIETSCPCLKVTPSSIRLAPGETTMLTIDFDSSSEPEFRGELGVDVTGYVDGSVVFRTQTSLRVVTGPCADAAPGDQKDPS